MGDIEQGAVKRVEVLKAALEAAPMRGKFLILTAQIDNLLLELLKRMLKPARGKKG